jgi:DNA replication protein DnaC
MDDMKQVDVNDLLSKYSEQMQNVPLTASEEADYELEHCLDYEEDGLIYCGICHKPKQHRFVNRDGSVNIVPRPCDCDKKAILQRAEEENRKFEESICKAESEANGLALDGRLRRYTFEQDDMQNTRLRDTMVRYVKNFSYMKEHGIGLLLYGGVGSGKTFYASCIVNKLSGMGYRCMMTSFYRLLNMVWEVKERQKVLDELNEYDVLVIDDLGTEKQSEFSHSLLYQLIDVRYLSGLPLIITTNLTPKEFSDTSYFPLQRTVERINEMCIHINSGNYNRRVVKSKELLHAQNILYGMGNLTVVTGNKK